MAWIRTVPIEEADERLRDALAELRRLMPDDYKGIGLGGIIGTHSLIPEAMLHAFGTFGVAMSPDLPLTRRQHEMIATVVSAVNRCGY